MGKMKELYQDKVEDDHSYYEDEINRLLAWSNHLMDSGIILADAVMNARNNGYVLPAYLHNAVVNPLHLFLSEKQEREKRLLKTFCKSNNPDNMCDDCNCWKKTREYCS